MKLSRKSGILVHPSSFVSRFGIGDFGLGAREFLDFAHESGARLWQVLPLGETGFSDSPYQSYSTFAGNSLLICPEMLEELGLLSEHDFLDCPDFDKVHVDYLNVSAYKAKLFKKAFNNFRTIDKNPKAQPLLTEFERFIIEESFWLDDFSTFMAIKDDLTKKRKFEQESPEYHAFRKENLKFMDENAIKDFYYGASLFSWKKDIRTREKNAVLAAQEALCEEISYYKFLQFFFYKQWRELKAYANKLDIQIIGDMPIFVAMDSADVWAHPDHFLLDKKGQPLKVAGVPPDYFSETGQLWGNPLYDWKVHEKNNFSWWKSRIKFALEAVDVLRIDHFRGFDEYWEIDFFEKTAINGKWKKAPGEKLFAEISRDLGDLQIIAEDLGIITKSVDALRLKCALPGMKVLQFAFGDDSKNLYLPHNFTDPNTVVYTGTHDNNTTKGWFSEAYDGEADFVRRYLNVSGADISWDLIRAAFSSVAAYAITPLQDVLSLGADARMNTPGTASGNWRFRLLDNSLTKELSGGLFYLNKMYNRLSDKLSKKLSETNRRL